MKIGMKIASVLALCVALVAPSHSAFEAVSSPSLLYTTATTKIDFSGIGDFSDLSSITDGLQTVSFSTTMQKRTVPGSWATWSSPPDSETATPPVLWTKGATSVEMLLSTPSKIFGFEAEPNPFGTYDIVADYYSGATLLGSIVRPVDGFFGARLFGGVDDPTAIDRVVAHSAADFAVAQVRYDKECFSPVPEPASLSLLGLGVPVLLRKLRKRKGMGELIAA